jgi:hypothetical protein
MHYTVHYILLHAVFVGLNLAILVQEIFDLHVATAHPDYQA